MMNNQFKWNLNFQFDILRLIFTHKRPGIVLKNLKADNFKDPQHRVIIDAVKMFYKNNGVLPREPSLLDLQLNRTFKTRKYREEFNEVDRAEVRELLPDLFIPLKNHESFLEEVRKFITFLALNKVIRDVDISNPDNYEVLPNLIDDALSNLDPESGSKGSLMARGANARVIRRKLKPPSIPTPYRQMNRLLNSGGLARASVVVLADKAKKGKTFHLVNLAMGYMRMRKKVAIFDYENGEESLEDRLDQNLLGIEKHQIDIKENEERIKKAWRKARRIGGEIYVVRMLAKQHSTRDCQAQMTEIEEEHGFKFDVAIFDYPVLMASTEGDRDELNRIGNVYLDIKNFAEVNQLDACYCAHHVTRSAAKEHRHTRYEAEDFAKNIDISRHVDAMWGLNQSEDEESNNVQRIEVIDQRDGKNGRGWFYTDISKQKLREFNLTEVKAVEEQIASNVNSDDTPNKYPKKKKGNKIDARRINAKGNEKKVKDL